MEEKERNTVKELFEGYLKKMEETLYSGDYREFYRNLRRAKPLAKLLAEEKKGAKFPALARELEELKKSYKEERYFELEKHLERMEKILL